MIRADDVLGSTFTQTHLTEGYDERDVDEFLDRAVGALRHHEQGASGPAGLTSEGVRKARFTPTRVRRGYDMGEVDAMLDEVAAALAGHETAAAPDPGSADDAPVSAGRARSTSSPAATTAPRPSLGARILRVLRGDPR